MNDDLSRVPGSATSARTAAPAAKETALTWFRDINQRLSSFMTKKREEEAIIEAIEEIIEEPEGSPSDHAEKELLTNLLNARERKVADIMIPRADIFAAEESTPLKKMALMMSESGHSRMPIYRKTLDDVIGFVHIKDITTYLVNDRPAQLKELLRKLFFAPPGMPVIKLLLQMRQKRRHMALVVDEFGGVDGLVTIEDVVEEIVGEIEDEYDDPAISLPLQRKPDGSVVVDARMPLDDFEEHVGDILSEQDRANSDTLAGLVFALAGRIPVKGEKLPHTSGMIFEVLDADTRRVKRLRILNLPAPANTGTATPQTSV